MAPLRSASPRPRPFPARLSLRLDAVIAQLDRPGLHACTRRQLRRVKGHIELAAGAPGKAVR